MASPSRSSAAELAARCDAAAALLAGGLPRTAVVSALAERYGVDRRSARRYVAAAAAAIAAEVGAEDLGALLAESVERLRRLSWAAETAGNLSAAVGAEKAAAATVGAIVKADAMAAGRTMAMVERFAPPSEAKRRRFRRRIFKPPEAPTALPF